MIQGTMLLFSGSEVGINLVDISNLQVIVVTRVGVMYLICINQGRGRVAPEAEVNTNQIHHIPTRVATNLYSY